MKSLPTSPAQPPMMKSLPTSPARPPVMTSATCMTDDVAHLSIRELGQRLAARELSAVELTQRYLQRIDQHNAELNAFITVDPDYSLAQAREADRWLAAGDQHHPLTGIPVALKDTIPTAGLRTTAGSRVLDDWVPDADPPVVRTAAVVRGGRHREDEPARVRLRRDVGERALRPGTQPVGSASRGRRIEWGLGRCGGGGARRRSRRH